MHAALPLPSFESLASLADDDDLTLVRDLTPEEAPLPLVPTMRRAGVGVEVRETFHPNPKPNLASLIVFLDS